MLMLDAPLFWSDEVTDFSCWAVAFIVNAGRLATATMPVLRTRNLRRDVAPRTILFGSFMMILRVMLPGHSRVVFDGRPPLVRIHIAGEGCLFNSADPFSRSCTSGAFHQESAVCQVTSWDCGCRTLGEARDVNA